MQIPVRWLVLLAASLLICPVQAAPKFSSEELQHMREELGVNEFTAPSIEVIIQELDSLKPLPFEKVWRDLPDNTPQDRARLALSTGAVLADGFLAVTSQKQSRIEPIGRVLVKLSKGLGVSDRVTKHSRSILEKAARQQWSDIKQELVRTQADVEAAMLNLKDEEIAHLVALGGWLRGLEITAGAVYDEYSEERARRLIQPELLDYFIDRASTLNPNLKKTKLVQTLDRNLKEVRQIVAKQVDVPVTKDEVKRIRDLVRDINDLVAKGEE